MIVDTGVMPAAPITQNHFPDLKTKQGLLELLCLQSYVLVYPALHPDAYSDVPPSSNPLGVALPMSEDRYTEYQFALFCSVQLASHIHEHFAIQYTGDTQHDMYSTFQKVVEVCSSSHDFSDNASMNSHVCTVHHHPHGLLPLPL